MPNVDIDVEDFYWECSNSDKQFLVKWLKEDGLIEEPQPIYFPESKNYLDDEWEEIIKKLAMNRLVLSNEQIDYIREISKNLI